MDMNLMKQMADMMLEELIKETGDKCAIAMKALDDIRKKQRKVMKEKEGFTNLEQII